MKLFLKIFLLCSSLLLASCSSIEGLSTKESIADQGICTPLEYGFNKILYNAKIKFYGKFFSGLFLFKYSSETKTHNIVFLSHMGLTLLEFKYANSTFNIVNKSAVFDNDKAISTLMNDLELLISDIKNTSNVVFVSDENSKDLKSARRNKMIYYFYNTDNQIYKIKRNNFLTSVDVSVSQYDNGLAKLISFDHKGIKLNIDLTLITRN